VREFAIRPEEEAIGPDRPGSRPDLAGIAPGPAGVGTNRPGSASGETRVVAEEAFPATPPAGSGPKRFRVRLRPRHVESDRAEILERAAPIRPGLAAPATQFSGSRRGEPMVRVEPEAFGLSLALVGTALDKVESVLTPVGSPLTSVGTKQERNPSPRNA